MNYQFLEKLPEAFILESRFVMDDETFSFWFTEPAPVENYFQHYIDVELVKDWIDTKPEYCMTCNGISYVIIARYRESYFLVDGDPASSATTISTATYLQIMRKVGKL